MPIQLALLIILIASIFLSYHFCVCRLNVSLGLPLILHFVALKCNVSVVKASPFRHTVTRCFFSNILANISLVKGTVARLNFIALNLIITVLNSE